MKYRVVLVSVAIVLNIASAQLLANTKRYQTEPAAKQMPRLTKRSAMQIIKQKYAGKVLRVSENKKFYTIRLLQKKGKVVDYHVNKLNGKIKKDNTHAYSNN